MSGPFSVACGGMEVRRKWVNRGMVRSRVVPFTCEECGGQFAEPAGRPCRPWARVM